MVINVGIFNCLHFICASILSYYDSTVAMLHNKNRPFFEVATIMLLLLRRLGGTKTLHLRVFLKAVNKPQPIGCTSSMTDSAEAPIPYHLRNRDRRI